MNPMTDKEQLKMIKSAVAEALEESQVGDFSIYLFGSRAKGLEKPDSEYDILVVTQREFKGNERFNLLRKIRKKIKYLGLSIDVVLKSSREYDASRDNVGSFVYSIRNECTAL
jgi:predicted nucleotidyltransferase